MKVREIMSTRVRSVRPDDEVSRAATLMLSHGIRHLPVVDGDRLAGLLTESDLLGFRGYGGMHAHITEAMTAPVETVSPEEDVGAAGSRMASRKIGCLPVVENGKLVGMLTATDVLAADTHARGLAGAAAHRRVRDVMTPDPIIVRPDDYLLDAVGRMSEHGIRHLPVLDGDRRVIAMLSDRDVRREVGDISVGEGEAAMGVRVRSLRVRDVASGEPKVVPEDATLAEAGRILMDYRIGAVPVVDSDDRLVGIVSYVDLLGGLAGERVSPAPRQPGAQQPGAGA